MDEKDLLSMIKRRNTFLKNGKQDNVELVNENFALRKRIEELENEKAAQQILVLRQEIIQAEQDKLIAFGEAFLLLLEITESDKHELIVDQAIDILEKAGIGHD